MPFVCPNCRTSKLEIQRSLDLPPDSASDEIILQVLSCAHCELRVLGVYEESRRGALQSEAWRHQGFWVGREDLDRIEALIQDCPAPHERDCPCPAHRLLGKKDPGGAWQGLAGLAYQNAFNLELELGDE